jgi:hypothetical protein
MVQVDCLEPGLSGATWAGRSGAHAAEPDVKAQTQVLNQLVKQIVEESKICTVVLVRYFYLRDGYAS